MASEIILYDIPTRDTPPKAWSLNPWKTRLVLNYKNLPYRTEWVEYPDLRPTLSGLGIAPGAPDSEPTGQYTSPAVRLPDGTAVMESWAIAEALERLHPSPSLHLSAPETQEARQLIGKAFGPLRAKALPRVPEMLLGERSAEYFHRTRVAFFGRPLPEVAASEDAGETAWVAAEPGLRGIKVLLERHPNGPFVLGAEPSYGDFVLAGFWRFVLSVDKDGDLGGRVLAYDGAFPRHLEACKKWLERDDH